MSLAVAPWTPWQKKIVAELYAIVNCKWLAPCSFQLPVLTADTQTTRTTFFSQAAREQLTSSQYYTIPSSNMFEID
jgi:GDP-D-mannose dehydratase